MNDYYLEKSNRKDKKYMVSYINQDTKKINTIHFGDKGMSDYTQHKDDERKQRYIKRHQVNENFDDPYSPGALSRWILWNKPTLDESIRDYKIRFDFN